MTIYTILYGFLPTFAIIICGIFLYWYDNRKPKPKAWLAICVKCKYCVKTRWYHARIKKTACRTPTDPVKTNFITGKRVYPKFSCSDRNLHGTCSQYKRKRWRR